MLFTQNFAELVYKSHLDYLNTGEGNRLSLSSADLSSADLSYADLRCADLSYVDFRSADLSFADFRYADLSFADFRYVDLSFANLRYADLRSANLRYADLRSADFRYVVGNNREVRSYQFDTYLVVMYLDKMSIGCQTHDLVSWWRFTDAQIAKMDPKALEWWRTHKEILKSIAKLNT